MELIEGTPASVWGTTEVAALHHYAYYSADVASDVDGLVAAEVGGGDGDGRRRTVARPSSRTS